MQDWPSLGKDWERIWAMVKSKRNTQIIVSDPEHARFFSNWVPTKPQENLLLAVILFFPLKFWAPLFWHCFLWQLKDQTECVGGAKCVRAAWELGGSSQDPRMEGIFNHSWVQWWVWKIYRGGQATCLCAIRMPPLKCHSARRGRKKNKPFSCNFALSFLHVNQGLQMAFSISHKCQRPRGPQLLFCWIYPLTIATTDQVPSRKYGSESKLQVQPPEIFELT